MSVECPVLGLPRVMVSPASHHGLPEAKSLARTRCNPRRIRSTSVVANATQLINRCLTAIAILCCAPLLAGAGEVAIDCTTLAWAQFYLPSGGVA